MRTLGFSSSIIANILVLSMLFITFSQLRIFNLPIGFGELCILLLGLIVYVQIRDTKIKKLMINIYENNFIRFWLMYFILLAFSFFWIADYSSTYSSMHSIIHDSCAYVFVFYICILLTLLNNYNKIDLNEAMKNFILLIVFVHVFLLIGFLVFGILKFEINASRLIVDRFSGLANNPNQLGLVFSLVPFLLYYYYKVQNKKIGKKLFYLLIFFTLIIGYVNASKSLYLSWLIPFCILAAYEFIRRKYKFTIIILFSTIIFLGSIVFYFDLINFLLYYKGSGSVNHRIELLNNAILLLEQSPLIGFGPGAHISSIQNTEIYWEVHNTFIDISLQVGILGVIVYILLLLQIGINLIKVNKYYLLFALLSLIIFSSFHFVFRQPIFWFYLFYFYQAGKSKSCVE